MKIKSMTATFGKLEQAHLEFNDGLNLFCVPNEGGKSTWAAFWKAMLYGIDTKERDKKGKLAEKNRYQPWSGHPMEGEVILEWEGREITLRRGPKGNAPFGSFTAVYTQTQEPVPILTGENCGLMLTGVSKEVFERSAFIGAGGDLSVSSTPELERRIAALISTGQEDISYTQVEAKLKEWLNRRRVNRTVGLIPKLENELAQLQTALTDLEQVEVLVANLEGEQEQLLRQRRDLTEEKEIHQRLAQAELNQRFAQAEEEYQAAQTQYERLERELSRFGEIPEKEKLKRAQGELQYLKVLDDEISQGESALKQANAAYEQAQREMQDEFFNGMSAEQAKERVSGELVSYASSIELAKKQKKQVKLWAGFGVLWMAISCGLQFGAKLPQIPFLLIGAAGLMLGMLLALLSHVKGNKTEAEKQRLLERYRVKDTDALLELLEDYTLRCQLVNEAEKNTQILRGGLNDRRERRESSKAELLAFVHTFAPEVRDVFGCSAALSRALNLEHDMAVARERVQERKYRRDDLEAQGGQLFNNLAYLHTPERSKSGTEQMLAQVLRQLELVQEQLNQARGKLEAMGEPAVLRARQEELGQELTRRTQEYQALTVALDTMKEANVQLRDRFSPDLNSLTSKYMSRLTGERYSSVLLNKELEGAASKPGDVLPRSVLYLSQGTADQLYLSLRLAVCKLCLPDNPPLLLDDAFVTFDDQRLSFALQLLKEMAQEQQIIVFSCHEREKRLLEA